MNTEMILVIHPTWMLSKVRMSDRYTRQYRRLLSEFSYDKSGKRLKG